MTGHDSEKLLLRAEVTWEHGSFIAHTRTLTVWRAFVETEQSVPVGQELAVQLSFPRLVARLGCRARVTATVAPAGVGDEPGLQIEFFLPEDRKRLATLLTSIERPSAPPSRPYRVLLVEDNTLIREMFTYAVEQYFKKCALAVEVDSATNGLEAWTMLLGSRYDVAIVDHYLPLLDGSELLRRVRKEKSLDGLPVVGISVGGSDVRESMLGAGADLFLNKPIVHRDLLHTLEKLAGAQGIVT